MWRIEFNEVAKADLLAIDKPIRSRILKFFAERLVNHPDPKRVAEPLEGAFRGLHRFRIGNYRAVCHIRQKTLIILVLFVDHRSVVYQRRQLPQDFQWNEDEGI